MDKSWSWKGWRGSANIYRSPWNTVLKRQFSCWVSKIQGKCQFSSIMWFNFQAYSLKLRQSRFLSRLYLKFFLIFYKQYKRSIWSISQNAYPSIHDFQSPSFYFEEICKTKKWSQIFSTHTTLSWLGRPLSDALNTNHSLTLIFDLNFFFGTVRQGENFSMHKSQMYCIWVFLLVSKLQYSAY